MRIAQEGLLFFSFSINRSCAAFCRAILRDADATFLDFWAFTSSFFSLCTCRKLLLISLQTWYTFYPYYCNEIYTFQSKTPRNLLTSRPSLPKWHKLCKLSEVGRVCQNKWAVGLHTGPYRGFRTWSLSKTHPLLFRLGQVRFKWVDGQHLLGATYKYLFLVSIEVTILTQKRRISYLCTTKTSISPKRQ